MQIPKNTFSKYVYSISKSTGLFLNNDYCRHGQANHAFSPLISNLHVCNKELAYQIPFPFPPPTSYPAVLFQCPFRKTVTISNIKKYLTDDFSSKNSLEEWSSWL
jgi:hypothetical protein